MSDNNTNSEKNIFLNENLSKYSWFNVGGKADLFFKPNSISELSKFLNNNKLKPENVTIIGAGSNTLIRDRGVKGTTIKLSSSFSYVKLINENTIEAGASTFDKKVSDFAKENSISGLEFLSCIPGGIGGAVRMNCGCYGGEISQILHSINVMDLKGQEKEIMGNEINFYYRGSNLDKNLIILSAKFKGVVKEKKEIEEKQNDLVLKKKNSQPSQVKTCGSTFKNPEKNKAWKLIKESECQNLSVGSASISDKHCNFFVNNGNASATDIEQLIEKVKNKVLLNKGIKLELEIRIIGEK